MNLFPCQKQPECRQHDLNKSYKPSPRILRQHRVLQNLRKNKDIVITKPDKGNGVVILDRKLYNNAIQEIISDTSKFEKLKKTQPSRHFEPNFLLVLDHHQTPLTYLKI